MNMTKTSVLIGIGGLACLFSNVVSANECKAPHPKKVVVVVMENHNFEEVVGDVVNAPFINESIIKGGLLFTSSHATQHPSQPNYLDLFSGSTQGVNNANAAPTNTFDLNFFRARLESQI